MIQVEKHPTYTCLILFLKYKVKWKLFFYLFPLLREKKGVGVMGNESDFKILNVFPKIHNR